MSIITQRQTGRPALRGALFYLFHWGAYGAYVPFLNVYFVKHSFSGGQLRLLAMIILVIGPLSHRRREGGNAAHD